MSLAVAIQMDHVSSINIDADSSFRIALEAQARGHELFFYTPDNLSFRSGRIVARGHPIELRRVKGDHVSYGPEAEIDVPGPDDDPGHLPEPAAYVRDEQEKRLRKAEDQLQDAQTKRDRAQARVEALSIIADEIRAQLAELDKAGKKDAKSRPDDAEAPTESRPRAAAKPQTNAAISP